MKTFRFYVLLIFFLSLITAISAQEKGINYQAVIRDDEGSILDNAEITAVLSITTDSLGHADVYKESHITTTSPYGSISIRLGKGNVLEGDFSTLDWSQELYIKLSIDDGSGLTEVGVSPVGAVPYSLLANRALKTTETNLSELNDVHIVNPDTGNVLQWNGNEWKPVAHGWYQKENSLYVDSTIEKIGIHVDSAHAPLHIRGGNWNLNSTEGDLKIGDDNFRMKMSISLGGAGAGTGRIRTDGGIGLLRLGAGGDDDVVNIRPGRIGINEGNPNGALDIFHNSSIGVPQLNLTEAQWNDYSRLTFSNNYNNLFWTIAAATDTSGFYGSRMNFFYYNGSFGKDIFSINGNNAIGIGKLNPVAMLHIKDKDGVHGGLMLEAKNTSFSWRIASDTTGNDLNFYRNQLLLSYIENDGTYNTVSDISFKEDIQPIEHALQSITALKASSYVFKEASSDQRSYGFIAQEVEQVLPNLVQEKNGYKTVSYQEFIPIAVAAIQEQQKEIEELKNQLEQKNACIREQQKRMHAIEQRMNTILMYLENDEKNGNTAENQ
ncbi:MAG: hypothetical protein GVY19_05045 [Bacteroidetes bacterium]|jgi:hypothetical protein|nr:hypothetical protein [Bacteroidota bacterium]